MYTYLYMRVCMHTHIHVEVDWLVGGKWGGGIDGRKGQNIVCMKPRHE